MGVSWIRVAAAAEISGMSREWVRCAINSGAVGYKRREPRGWYLVDAADVQALMVVKSRTDSGDAAGVVAGTEDRIVTKSA